MSNRVPVAHLEWALTYDAYRRLASTPDKLERLLRSARNSFRAHVPYPTGAVSTCSAAVRSISSVLITMPAATRWATIGKPCSEHSPTIQTLARPTARRELPRLRGMCPR